MDSNLIQSQVLGNRMVAFIMFQSSCPEEPQGKQIMDLPEYEPLAFHNDQSWFASEDASHHLTTSSASQNWQILGVEHTNARLFALEELRVS